MIGPANPVAVRIPLAELKVRFVPVLGARLPVAAVANRTLHDVSVDSSASVMVVAIAAVPEVSWLPAALTPGRLMLADPLNETPPIVLAVSKVVAVSALPVKSPVTLPTTVPTMFVADRVLVEGL